MKICRLRCNRYPAESCRHISLQRSPSSKLPGERLEFWCMLDPWLPTFPVRPDPPLLEVFAIGAAVLVGVTLVHGSILGRIVRDYHRGAKRLLEHASHPFWASLRFGRAVLLMLVLHIVGMGIWATMLTRLGLIPDPRTSLYFTANSYTTLGLRRHAARLWMARTWSYDGDLRPLHLCLDHWRHV